ncbi:hypothetical protein LCGC14_0560040 [marine sediment metagenome]|uniref:Uncharacterized protein n=1 Tax=marine sediment metagenome TaxID=412755 RepID=A0A0F9S5W8_9ZZZZ
MEMVDDAVVKIRKLGKIESIVCNDCKEYHHISKEFFRIVGVTDENFDMVANALENEFRRCHNNHDVKIEETTPFPNGYNLFEYTFKFQYYTLTEIHTGDDWDIDSEFDGI